MHSAVIAMCDSCGYPSLDLRTRADINTASLNLADDARCGTSIHGQEAQLCLSRMYTFRHMGCYDHREVVLTLFRSIRFQSYAVESQIQLANKRIGNVSCRIQLCVCPSTLDVK